jgi:pilus assembly protein Flp/PilA
MSNFFAKVISFITRKEEGATMVEYGLMVALIAVVVMAGVGLLGTALNGMFTELATTIGAVATN